MGRGNLEQPKLSQFLTYKIWLTRMLWLGIMRFRLGRKAKNWALGLWIWLISLGLLRMKDIKEDYMRLDGAKNFMILRWFIPKIWRRGKYLLAMMGFKQECRRYLFILNLLLKMSQWIWDRLMRLNVQSEDGLIHLVIEKICLQIILCVVLLYTVVEDRIISLSYLHYNDDY